MPAVAPARGRHRRSGSAGCAGPLGHAVPRGRPQRTGPAQCRPIRHPRPRWPDGRRRSNASGCRRASARRACVGDGLGDRPTDGAPAESPRRGAPPRARDADPGCGARASRPGALGDPRRSSGIGRHRRHGPTPSPSGRNRHAARAASHPGAAGGVDIRRLVAGIALLALLAAAVGRRVARRIGMDGAVLRHHADLLRQLDAAHRPRLHDRGRGRVRSPSAAART